MSTSQNDTQPAATNGTDEQRHIDALAHLATVQDQISNLRDMIPSILNPALASARVYRSQRQANIPTDPETIARQRDEMYTRLIQAARKGSKDITSLRTEWTSEKTQTILQTARTSAAADADLEPGRSIN